MEIGPIFPKGFILRRLRGLVFGAFIAIVLVIWFAGPQAYAEKPLVIDYPDFYPFFTRDASGRMTGFFYEIITGALTERMGIEVEWRRFPWGRCQANVRDGFADAIVTVPTKKRLQYTLTHPTPFYRKSLHLFTRSDHPRMGDVLRVKSIADIAEMKFSVVTYVANDWNKTHVESLGIRTYKTPQLNGVWLMLAEGRGDIAIEWPFAAWPEIKEQSLSALLIDTGTVLGSMPFHLLVGKESAYLSVLGEFEKTILDMKADGVIDAVVKRYKKELEAEYLH